MGLPTAHNTVDKHKAPRARGGVAPTQPPRIFDAAAIAKEFPLIDNGRQGKHPFVYVDNAATTQKPERVMAAVEHYYRTFNANPARSTYSLARRSTDVYEGARGQVARFIGAAVDEVVFTAGATEALNLVAYAYALKELKEGDDIVITIAEHHSNLIPWQTIASMTGAHLRYIFVDKRGVLSWEEADKIIGPRTKILAVTHISNVLGSVFPVRRLADKAHAYGATVVADCAQSVAHLPIQVDDLGVDFLAFSGHKIYGPMGIGVLFGKRELLEQMPPLMRGGGMIKQVFEHRATFDEVPARFEAGTPNVAGAVGLAEALQFVADVGGVEVIGAHERTLANRLVKGMLDISGITVFGNVKGEAARNDSQSLLTLPQSGVISFNVRGISAEDVAEALGEDNIAIRSGALCAEPMVRHMGQRSVCRISFGVYNTEAEVDRILDSLENVQRNIVRIMFSTMH